MVLRRVLLIAFGLVAAAGFPAVAPAAAEFCPAAVGDFSTFEQRPNLRAFDLEAYSARTVSANVIFERKKGWYAAQVLDVRIEPYLEHLHTKYTKFSRAVFTSAPLYVTLPTNDDIVRFWVADAAAQGDTAFNWDSKGDVGCQPDPRAFTDAREQSNSEVTIDNPMPRSVADPPLPSDAIVPAVAIPAPDGYSDCAQPFKAADVRFAKPLEYPEGADRFNVPVTPWVAVAIDSKGTLVDAWLYQPSGILQLDEAALKEARLARYEPGIALCRPAPGVYLFGVEFDPT